MRGRKRVLLDRLPDCLDLDCEKPQIVNRGQSQAENFAGAKQVVEIGSAEPGAGGAVAFRVERGMDLSEPALLDVDASGRGEQRSIARQPGRQDAVK